MKTLLKRNVAAFAAGFRANSKYQQNQSQASPSSLPVGDLSSGSRFESGLGQSVEFQNLKNQEVVNCDLNLEENSEQVHGQIDEKDKMIPNLIHHIKDLQKQGRDRGLSVKRIRIFNNLLGGCKEGEEVPKKLGTWEKQKNKLQEDIAAEKQKISDLQQKLVEVEASQRKLRRSGGRKRGLRIDIDFQWHKDDLQRLEQDLFRLKAFAETTELPEGDVARMLHDFDRLEDSSEKDVRGDSECLICMKNEVSVVFLPCAHQVLCANCNNNYGKKGRAICPCCQVPIEQRIRVFGSTS
ncbi:hypothetical protein K7X08_012611 [Anisodus acutangulus]|uniref:RING-type domain-containing protein n=1 Tax=Anisodus acutangulus TaxID=402998 RepID=A0A9Q1MBF8_9SOLA|nr:hypothetical protein K7X08_012611 [Anisodus acutangulus]